VDCAKNESFVAVLGFDMLFVSVLSVDLLIDGIC